MLSAHPINQMAAAELRPADFASYPPQARTLALANIQTLQEMPLAYRVILLREMISYDWKMPAERYQITSQLEYLGKLSPAELAGKMSGFASLKLSREFAQTNWISNPSGAVEQLTAWLWSTQQMDSFRSVADAYAAAMTAAFPARMPKIPRLVLVVVGQGTATGNLALFRKLKPHGVHFTSINPENGVNVLAAEALRRAVNSPESFAHWYIDGGSPQRLSSDPPEPSFESSAGPLSGRLTRISYGRLEATRTALLKRLQQAIDSGSMGPEGLRSLLAQLKPSEVGLGSRLASVLNSGRLAVFDDEMEADHDDDVLNHFQLSLLTEGSGTQIFSTTFVQWAARECLRRAEPETLLLRYAPRQEMQTMNAMLSGAVIGASDPAGSLVDADMGAYYTWLNLRRLPGSEQARFLAWYEAHGEAVAIGPGLAQGTTSNTVMDMPHILSLLT